MLTHGTLGIHKGEMDRPRFEASRDELGRAGYELTWVFIEQKLHKEKDGHVLVFKRRVRLNVVLAGT